MRDPVSKKQGCYLLSFLWKCILYTRIHINKHVHTRKCPASWWLLWWYQLVRGEQKGRRGSLIRRCWQFVKDQVSRRRRRSGLPWSFLPGLTARFLHNAQQAHTCFCWALLAKEATMGSWSSSKVSDAHRCALAMPLICFLSQSFPRLPGMTHGLGPVGVGPTWTTLCLPCAFNQQTVLPKWLGGLLTRPPPPPPLTRNTQSLLSPP